MYGCVFLRHPDGCVSSGFFFLILRHPPAERAESCFISVGSEEPEWSGVLSSPPHAGRLRPASSVLGAGPRRQSTPWASTQSTLAAQGKVGGLGCDRGKGVRGQAEKMQAGERERRGRLGVCRVLGPDSDPDFC